VQAESGKRRRRRRPRKRDLRASGTARVVVVVGRPGISRGDRSPVASVTRGGCFPPPRVRSRLARFSIARRDLCKRVIQKRVTESVNRGDSRVDLATTPRSGPVAEQPPLFFLSFAVHVGTRNGWYIPGKESRLVRRKTGSIVPTSVGLT